MFRCGSSVGILLALALSSPGYADLNIDGLGLEKTLEYKVKDAGTDWIRANFTALPENELKDKRLFLSAVAEGKWRVALDHLRRWRATVVGASSVILEVAEVDLLQRLDYSAASEQKVWGLLDAAWVGTEFEESVSGALGRLVASQKKWFQPERVLKIPAGSVQRLRLELEQIRQAALTGDSSRPLTQSQGATHPTIALSVGLAAAQSGDLQKALDQLKMTRSSTLVTERQKQDAYLGIARVLYEAKYYREALVFYQQVSLAHPQWVEAQEEMAWIYLKRGEPSVALKQVWSARRGLKERRFLPGIDLVAIAAEMKRCNYAAAAQEVSSFKKRYQQTAARADAMSHSDIKEWLAYFEEPSSDAPIANREDQPKRLLLEIALSAPVQRAAHRIRVLKAEKKRLMTAYRESESLPLPSTGRRKYYLDYANQVSGGMRSERLRMAKELSEQTTVRLSELATMARTALELDFLIVDQVRTRLADRIDQKKVRKVEVAQLERSRSGKETWNYESEFWVDEIGQVDAVGGNLCGK